MRKFIMIGCDLHDKSMLLKIAEGRDAPEVRSFDNSPKGRKTMIAYLKRRAKDAGGAVLVFAYEASGQGFGLYDELTDAGIRCYVLAPTKIARSQRHKSQKTDEKDAQQILELLRAFVLAGNPLPKVWIPDHQTRDDREMVRMRLDVGDKATGVKTQIQSLLKRNHLHRPKALGKGWTKSFWAWLERSLAQPADPKQSPLMAGARASLSSLLRQLRFLEAERDRLDDQLVSLAWSPRYAALIREVTTLCGVGLLTALVFLTEMGDVSRFANRRQLGAYLGLVPRSNESGESNDRKGHITRQGSPRVRKVLCQAAWCRVRYNAEEREVYQRIKAKNPKKTKVAVVAAMRRLAVRMWHRACAVASPSANPAGAAIGAAMETNAPQEEDVRFENKGECTSKRKQRAFSEQRGNASSERTAISSGKHGPPLRSAELLASRARLALQHNGDTIERQVISVLDCQAYASRWPQTIPSPLF